MGRKQDTRVEFQSIYGALRSRGLDLSRSLANNRSAKVPDCTQVGWNRRLRHLAGIRGFMFDRVFKDDKQYRPKHEA